MEATGKTQLSTRQIGGIKAAATNRSKDPMFYIKIGAKGGATPTTKKKGFAAQPREVVQAVGRRGGSAPRKTKDDLPTLTVTDGELVKLARLDQELQAEAKTLG